MMINEIVYKIMYMFMYVKLFTVNKQIKETTYKKYT